MKRVGRTGGCGCLAVVVLGLAALGATFPAEFIVLMLFGWILYLYRVVPKIQVDGGGVLIALVCLSGFTIGLHAFLVWIARNWRHADSTPAPCVWKRQWTATVVGLVILLFISGIAATGIVHQTGWLLSSSEPLISSDARGAVSRAQSTNNLKQIVLALLDYEALRHTLPPGAFFDADGTPLHSWMTALLPYLEHQDLYDSIVRDRPWDALDNEAVFKTRVHTFMHPGIRRPLVQKQIGYAPGDYAGNAQVLGGDRRTITASITDGTSNTILAGEVITNPKPWGNPTNWREVALGVNKHPAGFGSPSPGGASFLFADGSVRFIKNSIDPLVLKALSTPNGGETVSSENY